jgi:hypothetical protein
LIAATAAAQNQADVPAPGILPAPYTPHAELKSYLNLSDAQAQALIDANQDRAEAEQAIYKQIWEKERELWGLLETGSTDAGRIGQLMLDVNALRKKLPISGEPYRSQALSVLNPDQKTKLGALESALKLQAPAWQAVNLNLIDSPQGEARLPMPVLPGAIRTLPTGVEFNRGMGVVRSVAPAMVESRAVRVRD